MPRARKAQSNPRAPTNHRLNTYVLAASAAGVSLLALAQPSEAEIVYTPAHALVTRHGSYALDLNNDGVVDFTIADIDKHFDGGSLQSLAALPAAKGDGVMCGNCAHAFAYAEALVQGDAIGKGFSFMSRQAPMAVAYLVSGGSGQSSYFSLPFANVSHRYLGLKLQLPDGAHFGWARLNVKFVYDNFNTRTWTARITGYAYETVPGKLIKAGQISDDDATARPDLARPDRATPSSSASKLASHPAQFTSLGALALGADAIPLWRREELETKPGDNSGLTPSASF
jgi:hypothetical protein